ncbi:MAG: hypothetical protein BIP78_0984 [Candidatus Bipolaricaulis sibiricus]|uniref:Uncharacterized protein n=1 Tax=Bipolaricaulis sibiricus TaxID=2501609 RepID=A0A410FV17_BIPS1|nr:MAG: hypothetical protein BIP78_0984 [Candidatus Bipolaricaulis sibiricus]
MRRIPARVGERESELGPRGFSSVEVRPHGRPDLPEDDRRTLVAG